MWNPDGTAAVLDEVLVQYRCALPPGANVIVQRGARVDTDDVLARVVRPGRVLVIDVAGQLGIPADQIRHAVHAEVGRRLAGGEVLARGPGLLHRLLMPSAGTLAVIDSHSGCVVIRADDSIDTVRAGVRGVVMDVSSAAVTIETPAAQIYLTAALVQSERGVLRLMTAQGHEAIAAEDIDERARGALLVGGTIDRRGLERAAQIGVAGVLVGGMRANDLAGLLGMHGPGAWPHLLSGQPTVLARPLPFSVMVSEGFGAVRMHPRAFALLARYDRQPALVDAVSAGGLRRAYRLVIPISGERPINLHPAHPRLRVGAQVRFMVAPYLGHSGIIRELRPAQSSATGFTDSATAEVATQDGRLLTVPEHNLEALS